MFVKVNITNIESNLPTKIIMIDSNYIVPSLDFKTMEVKYSTKQFTRPINITGSREAYCVPFEYDTNFNYMMKRSDLMTDMLHFFNIARRQATFYAEP